MNKFFCCISSFVLGFTIFHPISVSAQSGGNIVVIDSIRTSQSPNPQNVTPTSRFGHDIGAGDVEVFYLVFDQPEYCIDSTKDQTPTDIIGIELLENGVTVARKVYDCMTAGSLSYVPTVPGLKTLTIVAIRRNDTQTKSSDVQVSMFGVRLVTALGQKFATALLPFTSRIFLEADALLSDANIRQAQFFHRSLPFQLSSGVPFSATDKVLFNGKLYEVQNAVSYPPGSFPPNLNSDPNSDASFDPNYRYIGPRLTSGLDYYDYRESSDASVELPPDYPAPPPGDSDLVISHNTASDEDEVYEVTVAGRLNPSLAVPSLAATGRTAQGIVQFMFAGGPLKANQSYTRGQLIVSNGRIYEVVQDGTTSSDVSLGFQQTTGEIAANGTAEFNFIPSKILKAQLAYWKGDLVLSNGNAYRVTIAGTIVVDGVGAGLTSTSAASRETKTGIVTFQKVGGAFSAMGTTTYQAGDVFSANGRIYKVTSAAFAPGGVPPMPGPTPSGTDPYQLESVVVQNTSSNTYQVVTVQLVIPQFQKYTEIDSDYAGVPLQEGKFYFPGDEIVSNGSLYEVVSGGTMGPVGNGLVGTGTQSLGGLVFKYISSFFKQISTIHPFADAPFPYSSFDFSFPYSLKWSPSETITNHYSWFGPAGYFETHTDIELVTRTTDSKDRTNLSATLPVSILPPIDARAILKVVITEPSADRIVAAGTPVQITGEVKDENGVVRLVNSVQFFVDGVALYAPDVSFPYTTEDPAHWTPTIAGTYILNALAIDDKGNFTISPDVRVNVTDNQPFVRLTSPSADNPFDPLTVTFGSAINFQGVISGSGGDPTRITKIEMFSDGNSIGTATATDGQFSFSFAPTNASSAAVNYQITARVTDLNGTLATSNTIYIRVLPPGFAPPTPTPGTTATPTPTGSPTASPPSGNDISTKLLNISTRGPVESGNDVMIAGFIIQGSSTKQVVFRGIGPSLTAVGVASAIQDPTITLTNANGSLISFNDDYTSNSTPDLQVLSANGLIPKDSRESALLTILGPGTYTAILRGKTNGIGVLEAYDVTGMASARLGNISTRGKVEMGDNGAMIAGFIVAAPQNQPGTAQRVVIRAIGPSLNNYGISDALTDPTLDIYRGSQLVLSNDSWKSNSQTDQQILQSNGLAPGNDSEAAVVMDLDPGSYSAVVRGKGNTTGVGLVEVYNLTQ
jgi:hypothetical protein